MTAPYASGRRLAVLVRLGIDVATAGSAHTLIEIADATMHCADRKQLDIFLDKCNGAVDTVMDTSSQLNKFARHRRCVISIDLPERHLQ